MRPIRFLLTIVSCILAFFLVLFIGPWRSSAQTNVEESRHLGAYFNWRSPSSLFPPSAIISLTDDNSTFFLARPAAFGPLLPSKSLSGQLWVGSGFGDDHLGRSGAEGELGCSDVPGWEGGEVRSVIGSMKKVVVDKKPATAETEGGKRKRSSANNNEEVEEETEKQPTQDDGTDDHLHHPLPASEAVKQNGEVASSSKKPAHADIQSLQESAEIAGKIVLLSRGGCGFLEKVKWVQRRGGVALIVGDDIRGGPLVTMYARGDTSNITIPALFTSHTTAHLLSSLIPIGRSIEDLTAEEAARLGLALGEKGDGSKASSHKETLVEKPVFTTTSPALRATATAKPQQGEKKKYTSPLREQEDHEDEIIEETGWFWSIFRRSIDGNRHEDSRRPPSSGNIDWILQQDFEDDEPPAGKVGKAATTSTAPAKHAPTKQPANAAGDGFRIGVQDWRDPDLVAEQKEQNLKQAAGSSSSSTSQAQAQNTKVAGHSGPKGGSITPSSGEYGKAAHHAVDIGKSEKPDSKTSGKDAPVAGNADTSSGWLGRLFSSDSGSVESDKGKLASELKEPVTQPDLSAAQPALAKDIHIPQSTHDDETEHEGLWITLTPTSMSSSPFFDTLLVLVVSPLVTLTVVYALLLLRSRIRRRRWRAPKSVVERLPVRTYQTMPSTTSSTTSGSTTSISSPTAASATTPLLPTAGGNAPRPIRSRPRSRTASEVPAGASNSASLQSQDQLEEKRAAGLAEWRRRYGGKQRECVVCLEEYIDGVSRVMSLPCGHEFHEGCM